MNGQILRMSMKERERLKVFSRVEAGELKLVEGADILGMSYRQGQRMMARYRAEGDGGIVHPGPACKTDAARRNKHDGGSQPAA